MPDRIDQRALNRATLARQHLLERAMMPAVDMVRHLVGMQAQAPFPPYYGLWSRLIDFEPGELADLLVDRTVVRIGLLRGTVHLVTADDALTIRPLVQLLMERLVRANKLYATAIAEVDLDETLSLGREWTEEQPIAPMVLAARLSERWPEVDANALCNAVRLILPLVQVPPRAVWRRTGQPAGTTLERWLGRPQVERPSLDDVVLRYLAAFGPASPNDARAWSGITGMNEVFERLRPQLIELTAEDGRALFDLPDAPRPPSDTPAPARLVAEFDNLLMAYRDRTRVMSDDSKARVFTVNGIIKGTVLVDGFVAGTWKVSESRRDGVAVAIDLFDAQPNDVVEAIGSEAVDVARFTNADVPRVVTVGMPGTPPVPFSSGGE